MRILLAVDAQNDFMPGGSLPVPEGDLIVPVINSIRDRFDLVIWTQDWHPANHCSFKNNGGIWPVHCVQNTKGAELHKDLIRDKSDLYSVDPSQQGLYKRGEDIYVHKGIDTDIDSYSGFYDNGREKATPLPQYLQNLSRICFLHENENPSIWVCGLATNFCVLFTALDSIAERYETYLITDACRGIDINPGDVDKALKQMMDKGVLLTSSKALLLKEVF